MINLITGIIFFLALAPSSNLDNCKDIDSFHPVRSDLMMQLVLKSYGYYEGDIDGLFGNISKKALINFQSSNNIVADGIIGSETCNLLLNKNQIVKNTISTVKTVNLNNSEQNYSQEIFYETDEQKKEAEEVLNEKNKEFNGKIQTNISKVKNYCKAEEYHQKYIEKNKR